MILRPWAERWVSEEANHFNPAYCGALIFEFVRAYHNAGKAPPPFALVFCALPIALHPATRRRLPRSVATRLFAWLEDNRDVRVGFADRACNLVPHIREAFRYAMARQAIRLDDGGAVVPGPQRASFTQTALDETTTDVRDTVDAIRKVARWFAAAGDTPTILAAWGIRV